MTVGSPPTNYSAASPPRSIAVADFDGDGGVDVAACSAYSETVSIYRNRGRGRLGTPVDYYAGSLPKGVRAGDLNGDGHPDLSLANGSSSDVSVLLNRGDGSFAPAGGLLGG